MSATRLRPLTAYRVLVVAALVLVAAVLLVGCGGGGDKDKVQAVIKTYLGAFAAGDGQKACDQMTGEMAREVLASAAQDVPGLNATSCPDAITKTAASLGGDEKQKLHTVKFAATTVNGDQATAMFEGATSDVELHKIGGRWFISGGLSGQNGGGLGELSVSEAKQAIQNDPTDAKAWHDLATTYDVQGDIASAIGAWTRYTSLRPKDTDGLQSLASDYEQQFSTQTQKAAAAQKAKAYRRFRDAFAARQVTAQKLEGVYQQIAALHNPPEPSDQLLLGQAAQNAGDNKTAIAAYKKFVQLAPDDPNAAYAKKQIKALSSPSLG
jgi:Flp pilus assembly protein TadD